MTSSSAVRPSASTSTLRPRALAVLAAVVLPVIVWVIGNAAGAELEVVQKAGEDPTKVTIGAVIGFSLGAALLGWGFLALLEKFAPGKAGLIWTVVASLVLLVSFGPVLGTEASDGTKAVLVLMHLAVGAALIPVLRRDASR
ncbi:DUF6069 family protein [Streptomyces sp. NPDC004735]|uniref:DUF6069 family protein n=1 Tax=Streptomyces TaxID=1883 RepID=UPI0033A33298